MSTTPPRRFLLITYPRSASNLLVRILSLDSQTNIQSSRLGGYHFASVPKLTNELNIWDRHISQWAPSDRDRIWQSIEDGFKELEKTVCKGEADGKIIFVKDHIQCLLEPTAQAKFIYGEDDIKETPWQWDITSAYDPQQASLNDTILPDQYLRLWMPIFLIRHPALAFPSFYRVHLEREGGEDPYGGKDRWLSIFMTLHWSRRLYDWYTTLYSNETEHTSDPQETATWPIILDADDIISEPRIVERLAGIIGMDVTQLKFSWAPATAEEIEKLSPLARRMLSTLSASDGIQEHNSAAHIDIDEETKKWREEFGESKGQKLEEWVRAAMPDYEFLKDRRMRP